MGHRIDKATAKQPPPSLPQFGGGTVTGRIIWLVFRPDPCVLNQLSPLYPSGTKLGRLEEGRNMGHRTNKATAKQPPPNLPQFGGGTVTERTIWLAFRPIPSVLNQLPPLCPSGTKLGRLEEG